MFFRSASLVAAALLLPACFLLDGGGEPEPEPVTCDEPQVLVDGTCVLPECPAGLERVGDACRPTEVATCADARCGFATEAGIECSETCGSWRAVDRGPLPADAERGRYAGCFAPTGRSLLLFGGVRELNVESGVEYPSDTWEFTFDGAGGGVWAKTQASLAPGEVDPGRPGPRHRMRCEGLADHSVVMLGGWRPDRSEIGGEDGFAWLFREGSWTRLVEEVAFPDVPAGAPIPSLSRSDVGVVASPDGMGVRLVGGCHAVTAVREICDLRVEGDRLTGSCRSFPDGIAEPGGEVFLFPSYAAVAAMPNGEILVTGGSLEKDGGVDESCAVAWHDSKVTFGQQSWLLTPAGDSWSARLVASVGSGEREDAVLISAGTGAVLFGGEKRQATPLPNLRLDTTCLLADGAWNCAVVDGGPSERTAARVTFADGRTWLYGGFTGARASSELWTYEPPGYLDR